MKIIPFNCLSGVSLQRWFLLVLFLTAMCGNQVFGQTIISGKILNQKTSEPLPFISVSVKGTAFGTSSDFDGNFKLSSSLKSGVLVFSYLGFKTVTIPFRNSEQLTVLMEEEPTTIDVTISAGRRYRNKDNPAVELIKKVIEHKEDNRQKNAENLQYDEYEKLKLSLINPGREITANPFIQKYKFLIQNIDSSTIPGKKLLPIYIEEQLSHKFFKQPNLEKTLIKADKKIEFNERYINNDGLSTILKYLYQDIDIYKNNTYILTHSFLSPIADLSPTFYKYFIQDTIRDGESQLIQLSFFPRNEEDLLFSGELWITLDGQYAVRKAKLHINKSTSINWVNQLDILLDFRKNGDGRYFLEKSDMRVDFGIESLKQGVLGERTLVFSNIETETMIPDFIFTDPKVESLVQDPKLMESFLEAKRPVALDAYELKVYTNYDSLNHMKSFNRWLKWGSFLLSGYLNLDQFEIGHLGTFVSGNAVEGFKLRLGGRSTESFSKRFYFAGNVAYGFEDERWKHFFSAAYAFNQKSIFSYPQHFIQLSHKYDTRIPGMDYRFQEESNPFLAFKRGDNNKYFYDDVYLLNYVVETNQHFRLEASIKKWNQEAAGGLQFRKTDGEKTFPVSSLSTSELGLAMRWAPNETMLVKKSQRKVFPSTYPVISATLNWGVPDFLGGELDYKKLQMKVNKRFILSQLGMADAVLSGGYLWGSVPFPLLFLPKTSQSYDFQLSSFTLMNPLEFISDQFLELRVDYHMQGFILNKIPLLKKLKLREVFSAKTLYGSLRDENNPAHQKHLFLFPTNEEGESITYPLSKMPYLEASVGIENIFNFFRVDYVRRLTYLNHPNVENWGIRASVQFSL